MTRTNAYQIIDSLLAEIDRLNAELEAAKQQLTETKEVVTVTNQQPLTASPRGTWVKQSPDPELLKLKSTGIVTFINPNHPFAKDCGSSSVVIIEKGEDTSIVAELAGLIEGQWLYTTEVNNNCLEYFNKNYNPTTNQNKTVDAYPVLTVSASDLAFTTNTDTDDLEFSDSVDFEEELPTDETTQESLVNMVFGDLKKGKPDMFKLVCELDRAFNKVSCLAEDKQVMLKSTFIELLGSDFKDNDGYDRRYKLFRSAIASSVEAMKFEIKQRMTK